MHREQCYKPEIVEIAIESTCTDMITTYDCNSYIIPLVKTDKILTYLSKTLC